MKRVAVLIDGQNLSPALARRIAELAAAEGVVDLHRVYTDVTTPSGWHAMNGARLIHAGTGKNAADLLLAIDAMDQVAAGGFDTCVLASSDGDFVHLATRLRERGICVIGAGEAKAPAAYRAACTRFVDLAPAAPETKKNLAPQADAGVADLDHQIRSTIASHSKNGSGMRLDELNPRMRADFDIKISALPERTWRAYLSARPALYDLDPRGPDARVRFRPQGFAG